MSPDETLPDAVLRYADHDDGLLDVHLPPGPAAGRPGPRPLLFYVHGGFWRQAWDRTHARPLALALAREGFVVASPEYRRVGGAGGWPATGADVEAALTAIAGLLEGTGVEVTTLTLVGHSAGGHLVLWLANQSGHAVERVVALAPVGDLRAAAALGLGSGAVLDLLGGTPQTLPEVYEAADPAGRMRQRPACAVVIVHGDHDEAVPVENSRELRRRFPWIDYRELAGADHMALVDPLSTAWPRVLAGIRSFRG